MSKEVGSCRLGAAYKPKERKPKKPHYIPRPWGKPYNYKCFQCPFTCMEKSHLYNHMKYSLCKNSLSLLIDSSDWAYKKGHLLQPELRLFPTPEGSRGLPKGDLSDPAPPKRPRPGPRPGDSSPAEPGPPSEDGGAFPEEEEEEEVAGGLLRTTDPSEGRKAGAPGETDVGALLFGFKDKSREPEPDFIITDVFSLRNAGGRGRETLSPETDTKPKVGRAPKKPLNTGGLLMEQWRLVAGGQKSRASVDLTPVGTEGSGIIPCYPPPAYSDYQEAQGLNLSLLGINYPLSPGLFSYLGPTLTTGTAATHAPIAQMPFLASAAQLLPPPAAAAATATPFQTLQGPERSAFLPRFYYPLLFEHALGTPSGKATDAQPAPANLALPAKTPGEMPTALGLLKVPMSKAVASWPRSSRRDPVQEVELKAGPPGTKEEEEEEEEEGRCRGSQKEATGSGRTPSSEIYRGMLGTSSRKAQGALASPMAAMSTLKRKSFFGSGLDFLKDPSGVDSLPLGKFDYQRSVPAATPLLPWPKDSDTVSAEVTSHGLPALDGPPGKPPQGYRPMSPGPIGEDLSKALGDYEKVERRLGQLTTTGGPTQGPLREQLGKIRRELYHIHQALEKATRPPEGPLDLSVKRVPDKGPSPPGLELEEGGWEETRLETTKTPLDLLLLQLGQPEGRQGSSESPGVPITVLPPTLATESFYGHTTKCEADSSVLLGADGRAPGGSGSTPGGPQLLAPEEGPLGGWGGGPRSGMGVLPGDPEATCLHSPENTEV
ncbi:proline-rich protein 35 [Phascolarctos cinereus]|uniref:Proline-rich protein 35 n=1 Tax=Phascolarctos cinereus TaxID=38626 RepID=A0A6P5LVK6_PHACI|nr:proline-rich protein 35 [Phascolarctos cinereus]XP_020862522.1 proline-rich protein 35 [Phascolarctos cinereus]XP_020862523.1 proline-rich protein 35 [Phascolarctos cinereus]XP_020862524.1 proline-rich protein 35 [Phascolarctos cinereus]